MVRAESGNNDRDGREIHLRKNLDGKWTARHCQAEISAQGETRDAALENLDAVVAALKGDGGHEPTDEEIHELGFDPDTARTQGDELPDILK